MSNPAPVPVGRPRRAKLLALALLTAALAAAGALGIRAWNRGADRRAALARAEKGPPDQALPALLACLDREPSNPELLKAVVETQMKAGAPVADVEPFTERWCRASPDDPVAFGVRADALQRLSRFEEAVGVAERATALAPNDASHRTTLAGLYLGSGRFPEAAREFRTLLAAKPTSAEYALALARAEWELGNHAEAARLTDDLLGRAPTHPGALLLRGLIHFRAGGVEQALAVFERVPPAAGPERTTLLYHRAQALDRLGRTDEAKKVHAELAAAANAARYATDAEQRPDDMALQVRAAEAALAAGEPGKARQLLDSALARLGPNRAALVALAACHDALNRPDLAAQARAAAGKAP